MQKAHLYEAVLLVNRGVDEAVRGLERLKRAKGSQLDPSCFDEEQVLFEDYRAPLNSYSARPSSVWSCKIPPGLEPATANARRTGWTRYRSIGHVQIVEDRRRVEGKPPNVRFFTPEEQREWELQYPKRPGDVPRSAGEAKS
ncbi:MAG: hypothetical protein WCA38_10270 [Candidatus Acidiferrales bacterium]